MTELHKVNDRIAATLRGLFERTQEAYVRSVGQLAQHESQITDHRGSSGLVLLKTIDIAVGVGEGYPWSDSAVNKDPSRLSKASQMRICPSFVRRKCSVISLH